MIVVPIFVLLCLCPQSSATTLHNVQHGTGTAWQQGPAPSQGYISKSTKSSLICNGTITVEKFGSLALTNGVRLTVGPGTTMTIGSQMTINGNYGVHVGSNAVISTADFSSVSLLGDVYLDDNSQVTLRTGASIQFGVMSLDPDNNPRLIFRSLRELHLYERATLINDGEISVLGNGYVFLDNFALAQIHEGASMTIGDQFEVYDYGRFHLVAGATFVLLGSVYIDYGASLIVQDHCVVTGALTVHSNTVMNLDLSVFNNAVTCWPLYNNQK